MSFVQAPKAVVITDANGYTINLGNASGSFTQAPTSVVLTDAVGNTLNVGPGVVAKVDLTAQQANVSNTPLYAVPAGAGGTYRISAYAVVTQAATNSSTLPAIQIGWVDKDSAASETGFSVTNTNSGNTLGTVGLGNPFYGTLTISAAASTNITYQTAGYASVGATPMQFAVHVKLEYLGA